MIRRITIAVITMLVAFTLAQPTRAQQPVPSFEQLLGPNAMLGTEFWIAIPPNEQPGYPVQALEIYVASAYDTEVTVYDAETGPGHGYKRTVGAGSIRTLSDTRGETNWVWEVRNAEVVEPKAIRISSPTPISLYVLNSKTFTSDGYMAIPTKLWDTNYVAVSYYDFREIKNWAGGFLIISKEDGTRVTINLKGQAEFDGKTSGGRSINTGIPFTVTLDKGMTYMVQGDGLTRAIFDLTGTSITSSKPVGVLGFHQRTTMPNMLQNGNGRNHLVEMIPPVSAWGKKYVTVELDRKHLAQGRGDMFRVVSSQPNTKVTYQFFDKNSKAKLGGSGFVLNKPGDFIDVLQSAAPTDLPEGVSIWTADKPIFVMQYSCSSSWDGDITLDPFMVNLTPVEQYAKGTMFQCPTLSAFTSHTLNLVVQVDTSSPTLIDDLKSLTIDGKPTWNDSRAISPTLLFNRITGTDLYWTTVMFPTESKAHTLVGNGNVRVGGIIYGKGQTDAYGWPLAALSRDLTDTNFIDTLPPVLTRSGSPKRMLYTATEARMQADPSTPAPFALTQRPTGIAQAGLLNARPNFASTNYAFTLISDNSFPRVNPSMLATFELFVIDTSRNAIAYFYVMDWAGNTTVDSIAYVSGTSTSVTVDRAADLPFTLAAFPQPARGSCTLRWTPVGVTAVGTVRVTDLQGRQVWEGSTVEGATEASIPVSALASGLYVVSVSIERRVATTVLQIVR